MTSRRPQVRRKIESFKGKKIDVKALVSRDFKVRISPDYIEDGLIVVVEGGQCCVEALLLLCVVALLEERPTLPKKPQQRRREDFVSKLKFS